MSALQVKAKIISIARVGETYYALALEHPGIAARALPGQFVMVKVCQATQPLLRRPLGIHQVKGGQVTLLFEVRGQATQVLAQRKAGEYLDLIGPLGNGFTYKPLKTKGHVSILVAGGMGVAPLVFLAQKLTKKPLVLLGAKSKGHLLCEKEFKKIGCRVHTATDDGSQGYKGYVTGLLKKSLWTSPASLCLQWAGRDFPALRCAGKAGMSTVYACGPRLMLKEVSRIAMGLHIPAQVSLEEHMACGIGACLGCVVDTHHGYKRVCKDGPVFGAEEIKW